MVHIHDARSECSKTLLTNNTKTQHSHLAVLCVFCVVLHLTPAFVYKVLQQWWSDSFKFQFNHECDIQGRGTGWGLGNVGAGQRGSKWGVSAAFKLVLFWPLDWIESKSYQNFCVISANIASSSKQVYTVSYHTPTLLLWNTALHSVRFYDSSQSSGSPPA